MPPNGTSTKAASSTTAARRSTTQCSSLPTMTANGSSRTPGPNHGASRATSDWPPETPAGSTLMPPTRFESLEEIQNKTKIIDRQKPNYFFLCRTFPILETSSNDIFDLYFTSTNDATNGIHLANTPRSTSLSETPFLRELPSFFLQRNQGPNWRFRF
jgi:hypothetical protein